MIYVFVFLLMGVLFESFLLPFIIITTVPASFVGAVWAIFVTGIPMNVLGYLGLLILVGIIVNNSIVYIDAIGYCHRQGVVIRTAILEAARQRFRPIIMTAMTTLAGSLPMALASDSAASLDYRPMAVVVIGGLVSGTLFTLFLIPIQFSLLQTFKEKASKVGMQIIWLWRNA